MSRSPAGLAALLGEDIGEVVEAAGGGVGVSVPVGVSSGRVASALEEIRWAKENIESLALKGEAPSDFAWLLMRRLSESNEFFEKFVFTFFPKLLPKDAGEGEAEGEVDGSVTVGMIERVMAEREKAMSAG